MSSIWIVGTLFTALGFGLGGVLARGVKKFPKRTDTVLCICAGLILGLLSFEVAPEAIYLGNWYTFILGFLIGVMIFKLIHTSFEILVVQKKRDDRRYSLYTGWMLMASIALHNLPIGISLGSNQDSALSVSILKMILLHNIPEGIIVFTPLMMAGIRVGMGLFITLLVAFPVGVGAYFGSILGNEDPLFWSAFISMSIGMIFMVTVKEILTDSVKVTSAMRVFLLALLGFISIGAYFLCI